MRGHCCYVSRKTLRSVAALVITAILFINVIAFNRSLKYETVHPDYEISRRWTDNKKLFPVAVPAAASDHSVITDTVVRTAPAETIRPTKMLVIVNNVPISMPYSDLLNVTSTNLTTLKTAIRTINEKQFIFNKHMLDSKFANNSDSVAILVQVHNRAAYLRHLVRSLARARGIENTLVIFSHDYYSPELNAITESIGAFPVLQIFYPKSMQLYPRVFPGEDPNDCPRNLPRKKAAIKRCNNAGYPDRYGHYREAKYTQTKHHWFWKMNRVFGNLHIMKDFQGHLLLLEEDHFVAEDFLHVLNLLKNHRDSTCPDCNILTIGNYDKRPTFSPFSGKLEVSLWVSAKHNMGMALNSTTWNKIKRCSNEFCKFDDYNWDWTLQYIGMKCIPGRLKVMALKSPRVFHIGECGIHHKGKVCLPDQKAAQLDDLLHKNTNFLYPNYLKTLGWSKQQARIPKPNGGWGDIRDHQLCSSFIQ
ncbi:alpha-1,6-mannosyl-glycoprotein 2-beta-N-acetylglucosaminyltransferase-like [Tubulanus polymorphus]|uniref:alpha-1,6-mannosyl-glycoprotein 2-beta-N-acetylglucosaminyltransferase-like n=1 Tax=Tubulanus polymorphus TaxID=672921 RepID=UPI003DA55844